MEPTFQHTYTYLPAGLLMLQTKKNVSLFVGRGYSAAVLLRVQGSQAGEETPSLELTRLCRRELET